MQQNEIFKDEEDVFDMSSRRLFEELLKKAEKEKKRKAPLPLYYRSQSELSHRIFQLQTREQEELVDMGFESTHASQYVSKILDSSGHPEFSHSAVKDLSRSVDEEMNGHTNGLPRPPQNPNNHSEQQPNNEADDTCGPLDSSMTYSVPRPGCPDSETFSSRSGLRREYSDPDSSRSERMLRMGGGSSRSLYSNSPGASSTMALTL
eukprot:CAMPEP_0172318564 /NCGR_PEP_ID=MMETSP1058-20130122/35235_1 /TAXON_ID=83371 /ORGANISM="Detonula confervacea, Strain CCMP 353" /LENGTH=205 /DNA_ID=CAMNT_0013033421 /DNA_START=909 /DNA_END=1526 /DNA_ORIENTATION=-